MASLVDTHCHLDAPEFAHDAMDVRARARAAGVCHCVLPAVAPSNFAAVRDLAHANGDSYALGIHPLCTPGATDDDLLLLDRALAEQAGDPRLVAVGEIGLDFFVPGLDAAKQEHAYASQLELARRHRLPVILHVRRSADRLLKHLRADSPGGIAHAFNGSAAQADACVAIGLRLGFGGAMTFERALRIRSLARELPVDAIVLETDAPDIPPQWLYMTAAKRMGGRIARNEPAELPRIGAALAALRGMSLADIEAASTANARAALARLA